MRKLLSYLKHHKLESILAPFFKMLEAFFDLLVPLLMADIINLGIASGDRGYILQRCGWMVLLGLVGLTCSITAQYFAAKASVESCASIRHQLFDKIQSLDFAQNDEIGGSTLITRMTSDVNQVQNGLNLFLRLFSRSPFIVLGAVAMAFSINGQVAWVFVITVPILTAIILGVMKGTTPLYKAVQSHLDRLTAITRENLTGVRVVRAFGREEQEVKTFQSSDAELTASQLHVGKISALLNPFTFAVISIAIVAILRTGGIEVNVGGMAAGDVIALVNYMMQILLELVKLANLMIQMTKAGACADRIEQVLDMQPGMAFGTQQPDASQPVAVAFENVGLRYAQSSAESLTDLSFTVAKGETVGVIGGTGSGKTSLVSLLTRYYDATSGTILLFGKDIRSYSQKSLRKSVATVMQKAQLFSGTIRSNLKWGDEDADDDMLWRALEIAQAAEIVRQKPGGLDEPVEQGGRNFSGGQRQRLSIARSLVTDAPVLILDDSSSALDYATDAALRKAMHLLSSDKTVFIVSQRANSLAHADRILVLDEGRLVGNGTHAELLQNCPVYQDIYESQFKKAEAAV